MVGAGYVGLVVGVCLAETGNQVICTDVDSRKIEGLKQNVLPIYEPGLDELVERNQTAGRLAFTTDAAAGIVRSDIVFIAVGTPGDGRFGRSETCALRCRHHRQAYGT